MLKNFLIIEPMFFSDNEQPRKKNNSMQSRNILKVFYLLFSFVSVTASSKIKKRCSSEEREKIDGITGYVSNSVSFFLINCEKTSSFCPIAAHLNLLTLCSQGLLGKNLVQKATIEHQKLIETIKNIDSKIFLIANCVYKSSLKHQKKGPAKNYSYNEFSRKDLKKVHEEHTEWVKNQSNELLEKCFNKENFDTEEKIYGGISCLSENIFSKFSICSGDFELKDGTTVEREYFVKNHSFKYKKKKNFHVVALPFESKNKEISDYIVYLIPSDNKANLIDIWNAFYSSEKDIKAKVLQLKEKKIHLCIPSIGKLSFTFDIGDILNNLFMKTNTKTIVSRQVTYFNVEKGLVEENTNIKKTFKISSSSVCARSPYLSFVFNMKTEKIIFITQDLGINKND